MGGFLDALGQKLADRWFALLVLPGAVYLAAGVAAAVLGQAHALDPVLLARQVNAWAKGPGTANTGDQILLLAALLVGAGATGLFAQAIGRAVERLALAADWRDWPRPLRTIANGRVTRRQERWKKANDEYQRLREQARQARARGEQLDSAERDRAYRTLIRVAESCPQRPTWSGDRIDAVSERLRSDLGVDTARIWPALWLIAPDTVRTEITDARTELSAAATLVGWAVLYAPLAGWWWPAVFIAIALAVTGVRRIHSAADTYALLTEAAVRLHVSDLADQLHIAHSGPADAETGTALNSQLGSGTTGS